MISAPAQSDYFLFIAEDGNKPNRWSWEIRRKSKPMGAKVSEQVFNPDKRLNIQADAPYQNF